MITARSIHCLQTTIDLIVSPARPVPDCPPAGRKQMHKSRESSPGGPRGYRQAARPIAPARSLVLQCEMAPCEKLCGVSERARERIQVG